MYEKEGRPEQKKEKEQEGKHRVHRKGMWNRKEKCIY
jgi:hypothetical protein